MHFGWKLPLLGMSTRASVRGWREDAALSARNALRFDLSGQIKLATPYLRRFPARCTSVITRP